MALYPLTITRTNSLVTQNDRRSDMNSNYGYTCWTVPTKPSNCNDKFDVWALTSGDAPLSPSMCTRERNDQMDWSRPERVMHTCCTICHSPTRTSTSPSDPLNARGEVQTDTLCMVRTKWKSIYAPEVFRKKQSSWETRARVQINTNLRVTPTAPSWVTDNNAI